MTKLLTVFGATGKQGGSVIETVLADYLSQEFKIRAVTRDPSSTSAKALAAKGVEVVKVCRPAASSHEIFQTDHRYPRPTSTTPPQWPPQSLALTPSLPSPIVAILLLLLLSSTQHPRLTVPVWESLSKATEVAQGRNIADAAKKHNVQHLIWSALPNVTKATDGKLPHVEHFDGKAEIDEYIRELGVPMTSFVPGFYFENLKSMHMIAKVGAARGFGARAQGW